jgi:hypothetical protein
VKPYDWVNHFDELFSANTEGGIAYETQLLFQQHIEELESDFMKEEIRERISKIKNNKDTEYGGI